MKGKHHSEESKKRKKRINVDEDLIKKLYFEDNSILEIGNRLGVSSYIIKKRLIGLNIEVRNYRPERIKNKYSRKKSDEERKKIKDARAKQVIPLHTEEWKQKARDRWKNPEFAKRLIENCVKALEKRPTSYEKKISDLCIEKNLPFIYTGNGTFLIGNKNPDFVNKEKKIAIEVYHNYWKIRDYGSCENYEKVRSMYFYKYGYKTIFIRTEEMEDKNWKDICLNKIKEISND
jgi:hypothetical protein